MDNLSRDPQSLFIGRDESWLSFNRRVLEEAQDAENPLLERVKFLAITASNLDEFVEIRVAGIMQRIEDGYTEPGFDGLTPRQTLDVVVDYMHNFVRDQYRCWTQDLRPALFKNGVRVLEWGDVDETARAYALNYYQREVDPLLTPITIDPAHPFPRVLNKALCLALLLRRKRKGATGALLGVLTVPRALPRLVPLPSGAGTHDFVFLPFHRGFPRYPQQQPVFPGRRITQPARQRTLRVAQPAQGRRGAPGN
jgi:polyphosphate kinase